MFEAIYPYIKQVNFQKCQLTNKTEHPLGETQLTDELHANVK